MFEPPVGFTGTQLGMTMEQKREFRHLIVSLNPSEFHHGDCVGADADAHRIVKRYLPDCRIIIHPPVIESKRAFCEGAFRILPAKEYLARNRDIVDATSRLIATPKELDEQMRSGTWSTIRYARKLGIKIDILFPVLKRAR